MGATNNFDFEEYRKQQKEALSVTTVHFRLGIIMNPNHKIVFQGDL